MEDGARRPPSYLKMAFLVAGGRGTETTVLLVDGFLGCWRTWHGGHRPTCRWLFWGAGGRCIRLDKNLLLSAKTPKSIQMVHPSKYVRQYLAQVLQ